jgi:hypothetical protein
LPRPIQICLNCRPISNRKKVIMFCLLATFFLCVNFFCGYSKVLADNLMIFDEAHVHHLKHLDRL